jgi:hypothetical protein
MILNFKSWWFEHNQKHDLLLNYDVESGSLMVTIEDLQPVLVQCPTSSIGRRLEIWDLFVGSELDVLGKTTILKTCDPNTTNWNEKTAFKLFSIRAKLIEEIRKYESKPFPQKLLVSYSTHVPGGYNLKGIVFQVQELREILMRYRTHTIGNSIENHLEWTKI